MRGAYYIIFLLFFLFFLSRYNNFSARLIRLLYKLLARTMVDSPRALVLRKFSAVFFIIRFIFLCQEGLTGSDVSFRGKVSRCRYRGIYGSSD